MLERLLATLLLVALCAVIWWQAVYVWRERGEFYGASTAVAVMATAMAAAGTALLVAVLVGVVWR